MISLEDLLQDPELARNIPTEEVPGLLGKLGGLQGILLARLAMAPNENGNPLPEERLLSVEEAAKKLAMTKDFLYRHADQFPFTVRPTPSQLRFSLRGIEKFIRQRMGQ